MMKTELITENFQSEQQNNLATVFPGEDGKKLYNDKTVQHTQSFTWEDIQGLSWIFLDDKVI